MKKLLFTFLAVVCYMMVAKAENPDATKIEYETGKSMYFILNTEKLTAGVTWGGEEFYSGTEDYTGEITIPATVTYKDKTYAVTYIDYSAFRGCSSLTSIEIPSSVTYIDFDAFRGCSSLTSIEIPSSVTYIENSAFDGCSSLTSVSIPSSVTYIGNSAFEGCSSLTSVSIPSSVTYIRESAFRGCSSLTSIEIPSSVKVIDLGAFQDCSSLTSIEIPSSVEMIVDDAFEGCSNITEYTLNCPSTCKIDKHAFYGAHDYKIIVPALTTHSWTSNEMWETYGSRFTEPACTLHANEDPDNPGNYYTTFYNSHYAYTLPSGATAYIGTDSDDILLVTPIEDGIIPKGEAVIIRSNSSDITLTPSNSTKEKNEENRLRGSDTDTGAPDGCYILSYGQTSLGFYRYAEGKPLAAHKAFLIIQHGALAKAFRMVFSDGDVNAIQNVSANEISNSAIYNLNGVRLDKLQKGINIVNGKKIIVK